MKTKHISWMSILNLLQGSTRWDPTTLHARVQQAVGSMGPKKVDSVNKAKEDAIRLLKILSCCRSEELGTAQGGAGAEESSFTGGAQGGDQ